MRVRRVKENLIVETIESHHYIVWRRMSHCKAHIRARRLQIRENRHAETWERRYRSNLNGSPSCSEHPSLYLDYFGLTFENGYVSVYSVQNTSFMPKKIKIKNVIKTLDNISL